MKKIKLCRRLTAIVLAAIMMLGVGSVAAFADDYSFSYYFANEQMTQIYITGFKGSVPSDGCVVIPDDIGGYAVIGIAEYAFKDIGELDSVVIPDAVEYIDENAFYGCGSVELIDKSDYTDDKIDYSEWYDNHEQDFIINGTTLVGYKGNDTVISIPYNCTAIADGAFKGNTEITAVYFEKELVKIGESAFEGCTNLTVVSAGDGTATLDIGKNAFKDTPWLTNYPSEFVTIGTTLVKYKGSSDYVSVPNVITAIADGAFAVDGLGTSIAFKVKVHNSVQLFGDDCFFLYDSVSKVYPEIVLYEGSAAQTYCEEKGLGYTIAALPGDTDGNGKVTASDARYVLRVSAKLEKPVSDAELLEVADVTGDNKVAADDARLILRISAKLETYSVDELLSMPRSDYELLLYASNAISLAKAYGCSYSKFEYQELNAVDMNLNSRAYFDKFNDELTPSSKAQTVTYAHDSDEALENLYDITLIDSEKIKSSSCVISDGYYVISITLEDETLTMGNADEATFTEQMFPVESAAHYVNEIKGSYWGSNVDGSMTYRDCTLEMTVSISTGMIKSMSFTMNYDFEVSGKIVGIKISGDKGNATATRTDVVKYTNFNYFNI